MKIAAFTETYRPQKNGVVVFLSDFLPVISKKAEVVLFAPGGKRLKKEKLNKNFTIYWVPADPFPFYEGYRMSKIRSSQIGKILKKEKPDIVHLHAPVLMGLRALRVSKKLGLPVIATYHTHFPDYIPHLLPKPVAEFSQSPVRKLISYVFSKADYTTAPTEELRKELEAYGVANVIHIPNGVSFKKFRKPDSRKFMKKYKIPKDKPIVLFVGRISFEKKVDRLVEAFKNVKNANLVIAGTGPSLKKYRESAPGNVIFTGFVDDDLLPGAYASADIFASASDSETFGLTFVEAMYFGLPVIGIRRLGAKEVIEDGKNGFLVDLGKENEIADRINLLLRKPALRKKFGKQGKKDAKKYDIEKIAKQFMKLYGSARSR